MRWQTISTAAEATMRLPYPWLVLLMAGGMPTGDAAESAPLPATAAGWSVELLAQAPLIHAPTAVLETSEGLLFLAQDPMDLNGPATEPIDYIVTLRRVNGQLVRTRFAENLGPIMGLEWTGDTGRTRTLADCAARYRRRWSR